MSGALRYAAAAELDLLEIHAYLVTRSPTAASGLLRRIDAACRMLADQPGLGARRDHIREGMRIWTVGTYLVLYRVETDGVEVIRVVHGRRNLSRVFPPDKDA
jgi:toxin ParE1/3/4